MGPRGATTMICRQCGTDKALICYRCGTATTEPRITPPASTRDRVRTRSVLPIIVCLVLLVATAAAIPYAERVGVPRVALVVVAAVFALASAWLTLRRRAR